ncbi:MAG: sulfotransferase [Pseudomonadota bacterium]
MNSATQPRIEDADRFLRQRRPRDAQAICDALLRAKPGHIEARLVLARALQMLSDVRGMLDQIDEALRYDGNHIGAMLMRAEALTGLGRIADARAQLSALKTVVADDGRLLGRVAEVETQLGDHHAARHTLETALGKAPGDASLLYNLASAEIAIGDLGAAEGRLERLLAMSPHDYDAYYNRATLRRQTADNNHIDELETHLAALSGNPGGEIQLCYALAKEYEDIGEYDSAFVRLSQGAATRRQHMAYRVADDIATMETIAATFDADYCGQCHEAGGESGPVFVLGLPRSGTTLVDRILSSHPEMASVGEINDLALAVTRLCEGAKSKEELIVRSAKIDPAALAGAYLGSTRERCPDPGFIVDKTPLNFLYIGLIARALPQARIVHVVRDPMDVGFAMYKTLFRMGYPFSYDLDDIGRYIRAKDRLMEHWETYLPGRIVTVKYEDLVTDQEAETRALIAALGLDWHPDCLEFHANSSPSATASAAQVRQPIYTSSIGKWKAYGQHLDPLAKALEEPA